MRSLLISFFLLSGFPLLSFGGPPLTDRSVVELQSALAPSPEEAWRTIPWKTGLLEAQSEAARSRKPLFIWAMDGHPLGCT